MPKEFVWRECCALLFAACITLIAPTPASTQSLSIEPSATPAIVASASLVDLVKVDKSDRRLSLLSRGKVVATFHVALGRNPIGHKEREGDRRTPEGRYVLDFKKRNSSFFRAIHISYPNRTDVRNARRLGVSPGGAIMIHGQPNGLESLAAVTQRSNWTDGCIALTNEDMQQVWDLVQIPTPIEIVP